MNGFRIKPSQLRGEVFNALGTGVYMICNNATEDFYIGSSVDMGRRWEQHLRKLECNEHHSYLLQEAFNTFGRDAFSFHPLMLTRLADVQNVEGVFIKLLNPRYNIARTVSPVSYHHRTKGKNEDVLYSFELIRLKVLLVDRGTKVIPSLTPVLTIVDTQLSLWN